MRILFMYFSTALRQLWCNKGRSILTMLGIIIGIGSVIFIMTMGEISKNFLLGQITRFGTDVIEVAVQGEMGFLGESSDVVLTVADREALQQSTLLPEIEAISAGYSVLQTLELDGQTQTISIFGDLPEFAVVNNLQVLRGHFLTSAEVDNAARVVVLGENLTEELFGNTNKAVGQKVKIGGVFFSVIGVVEDIPFYGGPETPSIIFSPLTTIKNLFVEEGEQDKVSYMLVQFARGTNVESFKNRLEFELRRLHRLSADADSPFMLMSREQFLDIFDQILIGVQLFISAVAAISLIVGGIGIMNIMLVTVKERTREIGLRKAIGAKNSSILAQFLIESAILTTLGGVIGIVGSLSLSFISVFVVQNIKPEWGVQFVVLPEAILLACGVATVVGIIFGLYPAVKAARLHPIESLRYE